MRIVTGLASLVVVLGFGSGVAMAQQSNKKLPKNATEAVFTNARTGAVVTGATLTSAQGKAAGGLKTPLEPGKKISVRLPKNAGCVFALNASFSDDAEFEQTEINLCADKNVRFTD